MTTHTLALLPFSLCATVTRVPTDAPSVLDCGTLRQLGAQGPKGRVSRVLERRRKILEVMDDMACFDDHDYNGGIRGGKRLMTRRVCRHPWPGIGIRTRLVQLGL